MYVALPRAALLPTILFLRPSSPSATVSPPPPSLPSLTPRQHQRPKMDNRTIGIVLGISMAVVVLSFIAFWTTQLWRERRQDGRCDEEEVDPPARPLPPPRNDGTFWLEVLERHDPPGQPASEEGRKAAYIYE
ncbi:hypothetical protein HDK64DRAFT_313917 [Phyllosticta capitalensis]